MVQIPAYRYDAAQHPDREGKQANAGSGHCRVQREACCGGTFSISCTMWTNASQKRRAIIDALLPKKTVHTTSSKFQARRET
jgi:hypothetical protein